MLLRIFLNAGDKTISTAGHNLHIFLNKISSSIFCRLKSISFKDNLSTLKAN